MWMSDKTLVQQRLAVDLASLIDTLRPELVLPFLDAFWKILAREWGNIDALRYTHLPLLPPPPSKSPAQTNASNPSMNKFLYLIRQYLLASFRFLSRASWSNDSIDGLCSVLTATPLNPSDPKIPNGMRYHVLDVYVDELDNIDKERKGKMPLEKMLGPVREIAETGVTKAVRKSAKEALGDERLVDWNKVEVEKGEKDDGGEAGANGEEDGEWGGIEE
jgi:ribosomal RNA-processing protein 1